MSTITLAFCEVSRTVNSCVGEVDPAPPVKPKRSSLRSSTASRSSVEPFGAVMPVTRTALSASCTLGPADDESWPYMGWKQPPSSAATAKAGARRPQRTPTARKLCDHIHDPLGDDDDFFWRLPLERLFYRIQSENGSLNIGFPGLPRDRHVAPLLAVNLDRQGDAVLHQKLGLELGPGLLRHQVLVSQRGPAFFGQMRHHRMEQLDQNAGGLAQGPDQSRRQRLRR